MTTLREHAGGAVPTALTEDLPIGDMSAKIAASTGWPTGATEDFVVTIGRGTSQYEKILCASRSGLDVTIAQRGFDGTTQKNHSIGETFEHTISAVEFHEMQRHAADTTLDEHTQYFNAARHTLAAHDSLGLATQAELDAHINDTSDAHDASAISILDSANDFTATDVEGALAELQSDHEADASALTTHTGQASGAHAATAISYAGSTNLSATNVEAALDELDTEKAGTGHLHDATYINEGQTAGGVLAGTYPNPTFASDMATQAELDAIASARIANALADAKGDLLAASANDTWARVPVGANGKVLVADSAAAAGVVWGAGMVLIAESVLTTDTASIIFTGIPTTFRHLLVVAGRVATSGTQEEGIRIRFNNDFAGNYEYIYLSSTASGSGVGSAGNQTGAEWMVASGQEVSGIPGAGHLWVPHYQSIHRKMMLGQTVYHHGGGNELRTYATSWINGAVINETWIYAANGSLIKSGAVFTLYGLGGA